MLEKFFHFQVKEEKKQDTENVSSLSDCSSPKSTMEADTRLWRP